MWDILRPDALSVWKNPIVKERLSWYYMVMKDEMPAKFMICKKIEVNYDKNSDLKELWKIHEETAKTFEELFKAVKERRINFDRLPDASPNFLDLKVEIAYKMLESCEFCERRCNVNRLKGEVGVCMVKRTNVHSYFHHYGEEAPLVPSGTIFYCGCNFKCVFCIDEDDYLLVRYSKDNIVSVDKVKDVVERIKQGEQVELLTLRGWRKITNIIE